MQAPYESLPTGDHRHRPVEPRTALLGRDGPECPSRIQLLSLVRRQFPRSDSAQHRSTDDRSFRLTLAPRDLAGYSSDSVENSGVSGSLPAPLALHAPVRFRRVDTKTRLAMHSEFFPCAQSLLSPASFSYVALEGSECTLPAVPLLRDAAVESGGAHFASPAGPQSRPWFPPSAWFAKAVASVCRP